MEGKDSLINKYQGKKYPPLQPPSQATPGVPQLVTKKDYRGVVESNRSNRSRRFKIATAEGKSYLCGYAHLIETILNKGGVMTLSTSSRIFTLTGKNLEEVERLLMEEKLREIHEFTDEFYHEPSDKKAVFIEKLEVTDS